MTTPIQVTDEVKARLSRLKRHPRQPYSEVIEGALDYIEEDEMELSSSSKQVLHDAWGELQSGKTIGIADLRRKLGLSDGHGGIQLEGREGAGNARAQSSDPDF